MRWAALLDMEGNWILASGLTLLEKIASNLKVRQDAPSEATAPSLLLGDIP